MLLEYKLFEPAFYAIDVPDWGTSYAHCIELGPKATVCIDTGHHAPGTNIEFIVAFLLRAKKLGAFDFNSRFYADDDLMVGAADPFQLFRIMYEIVQAGALDPSYGIEFMLDQCHNIEPKIPAIIRSVMNVQEATAKALLVDSEALTTAQREGDVLGANAVLMDAYNTDVRPLLAEVRAEAGLDPDPSRGVQAQRVRGEDRRRTGRRRAGGMGSMTAAELIARSNRLGADPRNTNYAGGNTSAKGDQTDPVTGQPVELMWVKGSGGDLGTLTEAGLAVLRLDRLRALTDVYPGVDREDEMVAAFDYCLHGKGGAAPSIDTAMHGLVDSPHVDHLHPDSGIALATAADGPELTQECFGDRVVWVPWRRPGFQLGLDIAEVKRANPDAIGCILGGHGITAWGDTSEQCEQNSLEIIRTAEEFLAERGKAEPFGAVVVEPLPAAERRERAAALAPLIRGLASTDSPQVGHFDDAEPVLDFLSREKLQPLAALGTSCPDHFLRTKVRPLVLDLPPTAPLDQTVERLRELHAAYREDYAAYYQRHADADSPAMRGADPAIVLVPGVGMFSFGTGQADRPGGRRVLPERDQRDARRRGGVDVRADRGVGEVPDRVLGAGGGQAPADAEAEAAGHQGGAGHRRRVGDRPGDRRAAGRRGCLRRDRRPGRREGRGGRQGHRVRGPGGRGRRRRRLTGRGRAGRAGRGAGLRRGRPGGQQRRPVDLETVARDNRVGLGPAARRDGQGLVPGVARRSRR